MERACEFGIADGGPGRHTPRVVNAMTMNCHACGAAVVGKSPVCAHCGARLATIACPACFNLMFQDARFCPSCGSPAAQWIATSSDRRCPGCREPMLAGQLADVRLHECGKCFGIWLDTATFDQICRRAEGYASALGPAQTLPPAGLGPVRYVPCPECRQLMHRVNFARSSGVVLDVCRSHGTWFDFEELHRIVRFIHAGGLDQARAREKTDLVQERIRAQAARNHSEPTHYDSSLGGSSPELLIEVASAAAQILFSLFTRR